MSQLTIVQCEQSWLCGSVLDCHPDVSGSTPTRSMQILKEFLNVIFCCLVFSLSFTLSYVINYFEILL